MRQRINAVHKAFRHDHRMEYRPPKCRRLDPLHSITRSAAQEVLVIPRCVRGATVIVNNDDVHDEDCHLSSNDLGFNSNKYPRAVFLNCCWCIPFLIFYVVANEEDVCTNPMSKPNTLQEAAFSSSPSQQTILWQQPYRHRRCWCMRCFTCTYTIKPIAQGAERLTVIVCVSVMAIRSQSTKCSLNRTWNAIPIHFRSMRLHHQTYY